MIECKGTRKQGAQVRRFRYTVALQPALAELLRLYDRLGGAVPAAEAELDLAIERCLGARPAGREDAHARLQHLMRARDLHRYVLEDADLSALKLRLCERLLYHGSAPERWAAIRELLLERLDAICETPLPGLPGNVERYKRALSDCTSRLGKLLVATALFNLDLDDEAPPPNLMIQFRRGAFPLHGWELCAQGGRGAQLGALGAWSPANPLARWEYLAADLAWQVFQRQQAGAERRPWARDAGQAATLERAAQPPPVQAPSTAGAERIYARCDADEADRGAPQLELFPLDAAAFSAELLRRSHARHGPDGPRLLALLLARLHEGAPGAPLELHLEALAASAGLGDASARALRARTQRLERIVADLAGIELTRVSECAGRAIGRTTRLLTVLGRSGQWHDGEANPAQAGNAEARALLVLPERYLQDAPGGGLGAAFQELPALLLECAGREHPCLLPLYVWLRRAWSGGAATVERSARALFDEAGIWVSETGRYRAIEALKRDLEFMREQGWLGTWRLLRSEQRDALEDRYRLSEPTAADAVAAFPRAVEGADGGAVPAAEAETLRAALGREAGLGA